MRHPAAKGLLLSVLACAVLVDRAAAEPGEPVPAAAEPAAAASVMLDGKPLFEVRERVLSFSAQERAEAVSARLARAARSPLSLAGGVRVESGESSSDILFGDAVLMSVTERDARAAGLTREELARRDAGLIEEALRAYRRSRDWRTLAVGALWTLLATVLALLFFSAVRAAHVRAEGWLSRGGARLPALRLQHIELLSSERISEALRFLLEAARLGVLLVAGYVYVSLILSFFPWTRGWAGLLLGYILEPLKGILSAVVRFIPDAFFIAVTVMVVRYLLRLIHLVFGEVGRGRLVFAGFHPEWAEPTYKIARFFILVFTVVVVFPYLPGSSSPAFRGISVLLGILLSLGSGSSVANVVSGTILTYMRPFKTGDRVRIGETTGDVLERSLLVTRLRTIKNEEVTIPNALVLGQHVTNFSTCEKGGLLLHTSVSIGYDVPWRKVHDLLVAAARSCENVLPEPAPFVLQTKLGDFAVTYELNAATDKAGEMARTYSLLHQNIQDKFAEAGIEILSPTFEVRRDGPARTVPARTAS